MSFATDFEKHAGGLIADLQVKRAEIVDALYEISLRAQEQQFKLSAEDTDKLLALRVLEAVNLAEIERLRNLIGVYHGRERDALLAEQDKKRQETKRKNAERRNAPGWSEPVLVSARVERPSDLQSSLVGAAPPWQWSWDGCCGFVPFSEMEPLPTFGMGG